MLFIDVDVKRSRSSFEIALCSYRIFEIWIRCSMTTFLVGFSYPILLSPSLADRYLLALNIGFVIAFLGAPRAFLGLNFCNQSISTSRYPRYVSAFISNGTLVGKLCSVSQSSRNFSLILLSEFDDIFFSGDMSGPSFHQH